MNNETFEEKAARIKAMVEAMCQQRIVLTEAREDWLKVMFSLRELGIYGFDLFDRLSAMAGSSSGYSQEECVRQWKKMRSSSQNGQKCNLGTLMAMASQQGFDVKAFHRQWFSEHSDTWHPTPQQLPTPHATPDEEAAPVLTDPRQHPLGLDFVPAQPIHFDWVQRTCRSSSRLMQGLVKRGYFTPEQMQHAVREYWLGAKIDGAIIFWYIDHRWRVRDGKVMWYTEDCHRVRNEVGKGHVDWVGNMLKRGAIDQSNAQEVIPPDWSQQLCLYGQHLLARYPDRPVALVESEKTAVICSELMAGSGFIWLATGGLNHFCPESFMPLLGRTVRVFPDTDLDGKTFARWCEIAHLGQRYTQRVVKIDDLLERNATLAQKQGKIDLADYLLEAAEMRLSAEDAASPVPTERERRALADPHLREMMVEFPLVKEVLGLVTVG